MPVPLLPVDLGPGVRAWYTTSAGGVSSGPYAPLAGQHDGHNLRQHDGGLNLGDHVGDDPAAVAANRARLDRAVGAPVAWMRQVHGAVVQALAPGTPLRECDALVAVAVAGPAPVAVGVLVADCVPVLLAAPDGALVSAVHVGRAGLVRGVLQAALRALDERGAPPAVVRAAVGPSICGRCYEVPAALAAQVAGQVPAAAARTSWGTPALDLPAGVLAVLAAAGVREVAHVAACTREDARFYSYRRAGGGRTGRFAGVVLPA
ncbi:polyphenol oxidase family protein [Georgenia sp. TF02-10]|uniref:polyphenol oxidase family protein n=1 Tax=Georgenia sp. TF02-10 TaxID=2917725 RepID=UPI001FA7065B|nr:polyphenol oxidase family protein [Georgenia sp. TF02-10]UNX55983.1 polyphenol oxidase family protein [Georgenia sp. TF02-10]